MRAVNSVRGGQVTVQRIAIVRTAGDTVLIVLHHQDPQGVAPSDQLDAVELGDRYQYTQRTQETKGRYLEVGLGDVGEAENADVDHRLLVLLLLVEKGLKRVDGRARLRNNLREDIDVNLGAPENIIVAD